jgi:hypothetical protein
MRRPSWLMPSTTPSATGNSASFNRLQAENGRPCSDGLDFAIFLISRRWPRVNFGDREPVRGEVPDHVPPPVLAGKGHRRDRRDVDALS